MCSVSIGALSFAPRPAAGAGVAGIAIDPTHGPPLTTLKVTGSGFCPTPCSAVTITVGSEVVETDVGVSAAGTFMTFVQTPDTTRPPQAPVIASQSDARGNPISARTTFTVTVGQPPPVIYPPPTTTAPPASVPLTTTTTAAQTASTAATTTTNLSSTSGDSSTSEGPTLNEDTPGRHSRTGLIVGAAIIAAAATAVAGSVFRRRRRRAAR